MLLDHNIDRKLKQDLSDFEVSHLRDRGWSALSNGELVGAAQIEFDVLVTTDKNMRFQTSLKGVDLAVAVLDVPSNRLDDTRKCLPELRARLKGMRSGEFYLIAFPKGRG